ncbi:MAG: DedA family protein [Chloroflexota bacterium]
MAEIINEIAILFENLVLAIGYPGVFLIMLLENLIPPIPTDPLLPFAGMLVADGQFTFHMVWATAVAGALVGSLVLYAIGAWADERVIRALIRRYGRYIEIDEVQLDRALVLFDRYGAPLIFFGRMIPVLRTAVTLTAGISRMALPRFILYTVLNSLTITGFWIFVGVQLGENWTEVLDFINRFQPLLMGVIAVALGLVVFTWLRRRLRRRTAGTMIIDNDISSTLG